MNLPPKKHAVWNAEFGILVAWVGLNGFSTLRYVEKALGFTRRQVFIAASETQRICVQGPSCGSTQPTVDFPNLV